MTNFNVLFTSSGRRVGLVRLFRNALDDLGLSGVLITADCKKTAPTFVVADRRELVPPIEHEEYVPRLLEICKDHEIRVLVPLIDSELGVLSEHDLAFQDAGVLLLASSSEVNRICFSKTETARFFQQEGIPTPRLLDLHEVMADPNPRYPFIIKPDTGSSSKGFYIIRNRKELEFFSGYVTSPILQEFVPGDEFTLDILADLRGQVRCVVPRLRIETRDGEISKGVTVKDEALIDSGRRVVEALPGTRGCITVQCFRTSDNELKFIEINPRFGGGFPLSAQAGANFPLWIIKMVLGFELRDFFSDWEDGIVMLRYDEAFYVDKKAII